MHRRLFSVDLTVLFHTMFLWGSELLLAHACAGTLPLDAARPLSARVLGAGQEDGKGCEGCRLKEAAKAKVAQIQLESLTETAAKTRGALARLS